MDTARASRRAAGSAWHPVGALRRHPLIGYFLLANGLSWLALLVLAGLLDLPAQVVVLAFTVGPTAAAVIVTALTDGRTGLRHWLRRVVLWRVALRWYLVALLGIPLAILLATLVLPGALAGFSPASPVRWLVTYAIVFVLTGVVGGPLLEEPACGASPCRRSWVPSAGRSCSASCGACGTSPSITWSRAGPRKAAAGIRQVSASSS